ncbi:putative aquaporin-12B [Discoglossus pictus]
MAGLNILVAFFVSTVVLCQLLRWIFRKLLPSRLYRCTVGELASSLQLCACFLELRMLTEIGMWGGGFGPDVVMTLLFLIFLTHGFTFDGTSANPAVSLQDLLLQDCPFIDTVATVLFQFLGMEVAKLLTKQYWALELTEFHMIQNLMSQDCSSTLHTSIAQGIFVEAICAFCYHLVLLRFQSTKAIYRAPTTALTVTLLVYAGGSYTAAFFNPMLAYSLTFHCSGNTFQEYALVYWGGSLAGMLLALFLYQGNIPLIFKKNLLYSQKGKYRTPKSKTSSVTASNVFSNLLKSSKSKGPEKKSGESRAQKAGKTQPKAKSQ